ncbi:MAG: hypothetical protein WBF53_01610, partial [Litorimonas sp.]
MGQKVGGLFSGPQPAHHGHYGQRPSPYADPCQVPHAQAPIPRGCHPSQVSIGIPGAYGAHPGGFPQQPQFGQPQYASGQYGTHASGNRHAVHHQGASGPKLRRPRFRGALDLGVESGISGELINADLSPIDPFAGYVPSRYNEGRSEGSIADGETRDIRYYANSRLQNTVDPWDEERTPSISFKDAWSTPATVGLSGEYILNDRATLFGRAGYTRAEGTNGGAATLEATVFKETTTRTFDEADPGPGFVQTSQTVGTEFNPENTIAEVSYDFSDMERYDLEAGGRYYLDPISGRSTGRTVTPFVGASAGASHINAASVTLDQRQLSYESVFEADELFYYDIDDSPATAARADRVELWDSQWVPTGRLAAGVEWQVTP